MSGADAQHVPSARQDASNAVAASAGRRAASAALLTVLAAGVATYAFGDLPPGRTPAATVLWTTDFTPAETWQEEAGVVVRSRDSAGVIDEGPEGRDDVLAITFGRSGSRWGVDYRHSLDAMGVGGREELRFSYDVYFPRDFEFVGDGKMGGLGGLSDGQAPLDTSSGGRYDDQSWSVRAVWKRDRGLQMYLYAAHGAGRSIDDPENYGFGISEPFVDASGSTSGIIRPGQWQRVEHHVVMNTPGQNDGRYALSIDGTVGVSISDVQYRTAARPELQINQVLTSWFFGGDEEQFPTRESTAYTDDWQLSGRPVEES